MCSLCGKRYFTVTALKKHHATHGEGGVTAGGSGISSSSIGDSNSGIMIGGSGGSSGLATMDNIEGSSKFSAKASTSDSAADPHSDDETSVIDASILEMDGLTQVCIFFLTTLSSLQLYYS